MEKMTLQQRQQQCERDNAFNERMERQILKARKTVNCTPTEAVPYSKCCTMSPIAPTPLVPGCPCEPGRPTSNRFCTRVRNVCETVELTPYGKEFARNTGKLVQNCLCVKFNGLQDSCRHFQCNNKACCMNNPFPNCPPAQLWKREYQRNNRKSDDCYN